MNFYDGLQSVYNKKKIDLDVDNGFLLVLTKTLLKRKKNIDAIKRVKDYLFFISPLSYYYLLYFTIPYSYRVPNTFKMDKATKAKEDKLLSKIKYVLNWSDRDIELNKTILDKTILKNRKHWESELGIK